MAARVFSTLRVTGTDRSMAGCSPAGMNTMDPRVPSSSAATEHSLKISMTRAMRAASTLWQNSSFSSISPRAPARAT